MVEDEPLEIIYPLYDLLMCTSFVSVYTVLITQTERLQGFGFSHSPYIQHLLFPLFDFVTEICRCISYVYTQNTHFSDDVTPDLVHV